MTQSVLSLENISLSILHHADQNSAKPQALINPISIDIKPGECVGIVGHNGVGKTTLIRSILGLLPKHTPFHMSGRVLFKGACLKTLLKKGQSSILGKDITLIFQDPSTALNPLRRVEDHFFNVLRTHQRISKEKAKRWAQDFLEKVHLKADYLRRYPFELSGGEAQRVMIALALLQNPSLLIADEPTTSLDAGVQEEIMVLLQSLQREMGVSIMLVSHDQRLIEDFCSKVLCLGEGTLKGKTLKSGGQKAKRPHVTTGEGALVSVQGLCIDFSLRDQSFFQKKHVHSILKNLSFDVFKGEVLGIWGPNGAGKTTLARALLHLIPFKGSVHFQGQDLRGLSDSQRRGMRARLQGVFQNPVRFLNPKHTVQESVEEGLCVHYPEMTSCERLEKVQEALGEMGLGQDILERYPGTLSGGEAQKVAIARALMVNPDLLILDEPTSSLDQKSRAHLLEIIQRMNEKKKMTFIIISHDKSFLQALAHRTMTLQGGMIKNL